MDDLLQSSGTILEDMLDVLARKVGETHDHAFHHWQGRFNKIHGPGPLTRGMVDAFKRIHGLSTTPDPFHLVFSINTVYSIIVKLLAGSAIISSRKDMESHDKELQANFQHIIDGRYFKYQGIVNFMDGADDFSWIVDDWTTGLREKFASIMNTIIPPLADLAREEAGSIPDLLQEVHASLFPSQFSKLLGEVYTPKWLVEFLIMESGWAGPAGRAGRDHDKILDPSCGTGSFIVGFISRLKNQDQDYLDGCTLLERILNSVAGLDLDPLALLSSRTSMLWEIIDLLECDSPTRLPIHYHDILSGECTDEVKNLIHEFKFIVGNPPWINWEFLSPTCKKLGRSALERYGMVTASGMKARVGHAKYDISAAFTYAACDIFLKTGGRVVFLVTNSLLKATSGMGFRKFHFHAGTKRVELKLEKVHDLTGFQPFRGATTSTLIIILLKGKKTTYPIDYIAWETQGKIMKGKHWGEIHHLVEFKRQRCAPARLNNFCSKLLVMDSDEKIDAFRKHVLGNGPYKAMEGANSEGLNSAYWIHSIKASGNGSITFQNYTNHQKNKISLLGKYPVEGDLVFPLIRSGNVKKWQVNIDTWIIFVAKNLKRDDFNDEERFIHRYPRAYRYFYRIKTQLANRKSYRGKSRGYPFYIIYGTPEMLSPFKVVWKRMGTRIEAAVVGEIESKILGKKPPVPQETISFVPTTSEEEAHYLCAILNSNFFHEILVKIRMVGTKGFASPEILNEVHVPKFDHTEETHAALAKLSASSHVQLETTREKSHVDPIDDMEYLVSRLYPDYS
ncbi:MAG: Eco57I restriction-modification methylase domain-containing protein [Promethearchaeota archaeon]